MTDLLKALYAVAMIVFCLVVLFFMFGILGAALGLW
jgi:hypothetical protein